MEFIELFHHTQRTYLSHKPRPVEGLNSSGLSEISMQNSKRVKLPKLVLPKFSGKLEDWRSFHSLFTVSIHEATDLAAVQKFQYLLTALSGEALDLVKGLAITEANYSVAWNLLSQRYQCERRHIYHHFWGLLELPELTKVEQIPQLLTKFREHTQALEGLEQHLKDYSSLLTAVIVQKMNKYFRRRFDDFRGADTKYPELEELVQFLEKECLQVDESHSSGSTQPKRTHALIATNEPSRPQKALHSRSPSPSQTSDKRNEALQPKRACILCKQFHFLPYCELYLQKTPQERRELINKNNLCQNCLRPHPTEKCISQHSCRVCSKRHHTTTCTQSTTSEKPQPTPKVMMSSDHGKDQTHKSEVLLATFLAQIEAPSGRTKIIRGIIDMGAQRSMITTRTAKYLKLKCTTSSAVINAVSETPVKLKGTTEIALKTAEKELVIQNCSVEVLNSITAPLPTQRVSQDVLSKVRDFKLADPQFDLPGKIDMLCGADLLPYLRLGAPVVLGANMPMAIPTIFGTALMGPTPVQAQHLHCAHCNTLLNTEAPVIHKVFHIQADRPKIFVANRENKFKLSHSNVIKSVFKSKGNLAHLNFGPKMRPFESNQRQAPPLPPNKANVLRLTKTLPLNDIGPNGSLRHRMAPGRHPPALTCKNQNSNSSDYHLVIHHVLTMIQSTHSPPARREKSSELWDGDLLPVSALATTPWGQI
nr:PREDICTED: uncharacterized protein LOC109038033 [Bemisia tabaci]